MTKTDREMLENAAKAAGYSVRAVSGYEQGGTVSFYMEPSQLYWNPLTDDGDALRLAVKLNIHVSPDSGGQAYANSVYETINDHASTLTATRRAIVRAAAEIGKGMK